MPLEVLLVQFLVLTFTGALWWIARRDLAVRSLPPVETPPDSSELEQLCATLEALVTDQARRLEAIERQLAAHQPQTAEPQPSFSEVGVLLAAAMPAPAIEPVAELVIEREPTPAPRMEPPMTPIVPMSVMPTLSPAAPQWESAAPQDETPPEDPRYAPLYALWEQGVTDPAELVRRTGLGRGEVDLILSLRGRRAL